MPAFESEPAKLSALTGQGATLISDAQRVLDSLHLILENPGQDLQHTSAEMLRLATLLRGTCESHIDNLALIAAQEPKKVPQRRISKLIGISHNTLRSKIERSDATDENDPFADAPVARGIEASEA